MAARTAEAKALAAQKARATRMLNRKWYDVYLFGKFLRPTLASSAIQAVNNVWHTDIVPQYGPGRMEEAKTLRRAHMYAVLSKNQRQTRGKKGVSHRLQPSLFSH